MELLVVLMALSWLTTVQSNFPSHFPPKDGDGIITLTNQNWESVVNSAEHDVVVEFFSPSCIYCIRFEPIWKEVAGYFKNEDTVIIAKIDASRDDGQIPGIEITGVPTVLIFPANDKDKLKAYNDQRSASLIVEWILENTHLPIEVEISYKSNPLPQNNDGFVKEVVGLNWKSIVLNPDKDVFVNFYAPWCPYSGMLQPIWRSLGERLKDVPSITIAQFDGTANEVPGLHLHAFPTLTLYRAGDNNAVPYRGFVRTVDAFIEFLQTDAVIGWTDPVTGVLSHETLPSLKDHAVDVPELHDSDYEEKIQKLEENVVVLFYAPWCEHSQELFKTWEEVYTEYMAIHSVSIYQMDATKEKKPGISIYPTIKIFPAASEGPKPEEGVAFKGKETSLRNIKEFIQTNAVQPSIEKKIQEAHLVATKRGLPLPTEEQLEAQHGIDFPELDYGRGQSMIYKNQKIDL